MFRTLADLGINVEMISTSEIRTSIVVNPARGREALVALQKTFVIEE
jgi:aspartokinase